MDYFGLFSTSNLGGYIQLRYCPPRFESKIGSKEPKNRLKFNSETVSKHPAGEARGFNVLACKGTLQKYLGFGLCEQGVSRREIEQNLWDSFNEDPVDDSFYPADVWHHIYSHSLLCREEKSKELVQRYRSRKISWEAFQKCPGRLPLKGAPAEGKMGLWVYRPDVQKIEALLTGVLGH